MAANMECQDLIASISITESCEESENVHKMFERLSKATLTCNIKSQQRNEADMTHDDKTSLLHQLYKDNPKLFLARFGMWLCEEDLACFRQFPEDEEIEYTLKQLRKRLVLRESGKDVKNRRYEALVRLEKDSEYFAEHVMRERCPLLYEQYIGQFMNADEKLDRDEALLKNEQPTLSSFIFQQIDREWLECRHNTEKAEEECMEEEEEEEEDDEEDGGKEGKEKDTEEAGPVKITDEEKLRYHQEFLNIMKQRFLEGLDEDFDYTTVDRNEDYDNMTMIGQDAEDKYFDEEEPERFDETKEAGETKDVESSIDNDNEEDYLSDTILQKCCSATKR